MTSRPVSRPSAHLRSTSTLKLHSRDTPCYAAGRQAFAVGGEDERRACGRFPLEPCTTLRVQSQSPCSVCRGNPPPPRSCHPTQHTPTRWLELERPASRAERPSCSRGAGLQKLLQNVSESRAAILRWVEKLRHRRLRHVLEQHPNGRVAGHGHRHGSPVEMSTHVVVVTG
jgi:hypothetical protein